MRITQKQVDGMFVGTVAAARLAGVDSSAWSLYKGEVYYSLVKVTEHKGHSTVVSYLGNTAKETYNALSFMREAFYLAHEATR